MNVNTTVATNGATALLLPAQNTHTLHDPISRDVKARAAPTHLALPALRGTYTNGLAKPVT